MSVNAYTIICILRKPTVPKLAGSLGW